MKLKTTLPCLSLCLLASVIQPALAFFPEGEDNFADAPPFSTQSDVSFNTFINVYGTEPNEPSHLPNLANGAGKTAWWKWIAPENGFCTVDTITSVYIGSPVLDTVVSVYTGTALHALTRVASNDNHTTEYFSDSASQSKATFYAKVGVIYYIAVDGAYEGTVSPQSSNTQLRLRQLAARSVTRRAVWRYNSNTPDESGQITLTTTISGGYSGVFQRGAVKYPFTGIFDRDGTTVRSINPKVALGQPPAVPITLRIDGAGVGQYSLEMDQINLGNEFPRQMVYTRTSPNPLVGTYNLGESVSSNNTPRGWVQGTVNAAGTFSGAFTGPDGLKFTASAALHEMGNSTQNFALPFYAILHANKGFYHAYGLATLDTTQAMDHLIDLDGRYMRPANPKSVFYQYGFDNSFDLRGRKYVKPALNNRVLGFLNGNGAGTLRVPDLQGELTTAIYENLTLSTANKFTFSNPGPLKLSLTVNSTNGLVSGSLTTTDNIQGVTKARPRKLQGLIFRDVNGTTCLRGHATGIQGNLYMDVITPQL